MESEVPDKDLSLNGPKSREISQKKTKNRIKVVQIVDEVNEKNNKTNVFNYEMGDKTREFDKLIEDLDFNFKYFVGEDSKRNVQRKSLFDRYAIDAYEDDVESIKIVEILNVMRSNVEIQEKSITLYDKFIKGGRNEDEIIELIKTEIQAGQIRKLKNIIDVCIDRKCLTLNIFKQWFPQTLSTLSFERKKNFILKYANCIPNNLDFYKYICHMCKRQREFDSLACVLAQIPSKFKKDNDILRYYGRLAMRSQMFNDAITIFAKIIESNETKVIDFLLIAECYIEVKKLIECNFVLMKGLLKYRDNFEILYRYVLFNFDRGEMILVRESIEELRNLKNLDSSYTNQLDFYCIDMIIK